MKKKNSGLLFAVAAMFCFLACTQENTATIEVKKPVETKAVTETKAKGSLSGIVEVHSTPPKPRAVRMDADPECKKHHQSAKVVLDDVLIKDKRLENAFVYIESGLPKQAYPAPKEDVVIDQKGCLYKPRVVGVRVNQTLNILNSDPLLHNVHAISTEKKSLFNIAMANQGGKKRKKFKEPQIMAKLKCDVHPWMAAYVGVMEHPYFQVTGSDGSFSLKDVPAGKYKLTVWHERMGSKSLDIEIKANENTKALFTY